MIEQRRHPGRIARALVGYPPLLVAILLRSAVVWGGIRIVVCGAARLAGLPGGADSGGAIAPIGLALIVGAIILLDAKATRELLYIRNLGLPPAWLFLVAAGSALALEVALRLAW